MLPPWRKGYTSKVWRLCKFTKFFDFVLFSFHWWDACCHAAVHNEQCGTRHIFVMCLVRCVTDMFTHCTMISIVLQLLSIGHFVDVSHHDRCVEQQQNTNHEYNGSRHSVCRLVHRTDLISLFCYVFQLHMFSLLAATMHDDDRKRGNQFDSW